MRNQKVEIFVESVFLSLEQKNALEPDYILYNAIHLMLFFIMLLCNAILDIMLSSCDSLMLISR